MEEVGEKQTERHYCYLREKNDEGLFFPLLLFSICVQLLLPSLFLSLLPIAGNPSWIAKSRGA